MPAIDLSRHETVRLVLDHKQFPVRHLCETASVHLISLAERRARVCSVENAEVGLDHDQREVGSCIAWLSERLASGPTLTAQIRPIRQQRASRPR